MIRPLRTRDRASLLLLLAACAPGAGCSLTHGSRLRPVEGAKTTATVGERVLPPTIGPPGSRVAAAEPEAEPYRNPKARISGRVVDAEGRPVAGATVRLADGSTRAGRDVRAVTDPAGGFTLGNLRPGSGYFLVAEADLGDDRGVLVGRAQADTAERGVQIRLGDDEEGGAVRASQVPRARAVSNSVDDFRAAPDEGEDLAPPAEPEATTGPTARPAGPRPKGTAGAAGWRRPGSLAIAEDEGEAGPNPLPFSIPPRAGRPSAEEAEPAATEMLEMPSAASLGTGAAPPALPEAPRGLDLDSIPDAAPAGAAPPAAPDPASAEATAEPVAAEVPGDPSANYNPFATVAEPARPAEPAPAPAAQTLPTAAPTRRPDSDPAARPAGGLAESAEPEPSPTPPASDADPEPQAAAAMPAAPARKWGDVAAQEAGGTASLASTTARAATAKAAGAAGASPARAGRFAGRRVKAEPPTGKVDAAASCEVDTKTDPKQMRLVDFQLPALDGQPVRFHDLDADFVLLDFWGTWCRPCLDAVPHLNELQKEYGPNRLKVVGIACERNPPARRKVAVAQAAQQLGIDYTVALTGLDENCPVQAGFQVSQYPTMILLDRSGKVVWRAIGWTESNQFRLDKILRATLDPAHAPKPAAGLARAGGRAAVR